MKIGVFGGTFNPPHIGHVEAANKVSAGLGLDLLIIVPAGTPPHKNLPTGTPSAQLRYIMAENAFKTTTNTLISDIEVKSEKQSYAIDTIEYLKRDHPDSEFYLLVGTDMYNTLDSWKDSDSLLKQVTPVELRRDVIDISSSQVRDMLPERKGREYVADLNYSYIIRNRLYGAKPEWTWLRQQAHSMLSPVRIPHVDACEAEALRLAERWSVDIDDAREAAILHDITKRLDLKGNLKILDEHGVTAGKLGFAEEKLLHSITGALLAKTMFGVSDTVAEAIKWHTTGKAKMTVLEKVIYIADYIEATRDFPGVDELRKKAYTDIDDAMIMGLEMSIDDMLARGITPNDTTYKALGSLMTGKDSV